MHTLGTPQMIITDQAASTRSQWLKSLRSLNLSLTVTVHLNISITSLNKITVIFLFLFLYFLLLYGITLALKLTIIPYVLGILAVLFLPMSFVYIRLIPNLGEFLIIFHSPFYQIKYMVLLQS